MRNVVGGLCCFLVALQVLVGVPAVICLAFLFFMQGGQGPLTVEMHALPRPAATIAPADYPRAFPEAPAIASAPPRNVIPGQTTTSDHPILQTRSAQGSPLAGTVLEACEEEEELFLTALVKAEAEAQSEEASRKPTACPADGSNEICPTTIPEPAGEATTAAECPAIETVLQLLAHLYAMAELDEQAGEYARADKWRSLARELRQND